jgi:hypothetical protein
MSEQQLERVILLSIYLPLVRAVLEQKNTNDIYTNTLATVVNDIKLTKQILKKENVLIHSRASSSNLFHNYSITLNGKCIEKDFFRPHMKNVIKKLLKNYLTTKSSILLKLYKH